MKMELTFEEAVEELEGGIEITLNYNGFTYEIAPAENFVGGDGLDGYISVVLGNVVYDNAEQVLKESIHYLEEDGDGDEKVTLTC